MLVLGMIFCAVFMTACHGSKEVQTFEIPEEFDETKSYEITFWAKNDTNKTQTAVYEKAIEDFQRLYPNITVNMRLYTDYGKIYNDVITNILYVLEKIGLIKYSLSTLTQDNDSFQNIKTIYQLEWLTNVIN